MIYTVKSGDTLISIAHKLKTTPSRIIADNGITAPGRLAVGESLIILFPSVTYTVRAGDTLSSIAKENGITVNTIYRNNPNLNGTPYIYEGQTLVISYTSAPPFGSLELNGYAYPYIGEETLRKTLPYLSYISIFSYGINDDGTLIEPVGDERIINTAKEYNTVPLMMLTSLNSSGNFSNALSEKVLSDTALSEKVIENAAETMRQKGYGGIDVDFEYISPVFATAYVEFLKKLKGAVGENKILTVSLAPKESADMPGLLYEGHDYKGLGAAADKVLVMTYEWGYKYGPPMAVSPINKVREVIDYALSEIPSEKIFMGMPNYGYDWTLPFIKGESAAKTLSNNQAVTTAKDNNAEILYDEKAASPYFFYYANGENRILKHEVWFEDVRSTEAMSNLAFEKNLSGISVWNIMENFTGMWSLLNSLFSIRKNETD